LSRPSRLGRQGSAAIVEIAGNKPGDDDGERSRVARRHHVNNDLSKRRDFFASATAAQRCVTATRQNRNTSLEYVRQLRKG
jgi:hypothetical protein